MNSDLKLIWILSLLLLLIILLSGIKVCKLDKPLYNRFIDRRYNYISEPFNPIETNTNPSENAMKILKVSDDYISSNLKKMVDEKRENQKINDLSKDINTMELKMRYLQN